MQVHGTMEVHMKNFLLSLLIGLAAAILDTLPMVIRKLDAAFILSAFSVWLFLGILIPRARLFPQPWLNGIAVALLCVIPVVCLVTKLDRQAIPAMLASTVVLGAIVGLASSALIRQ
jgi:hypothetical protein